MLFRSYLADDGVIWYGWDKGDLTVHYAYAASEDTARTLWSLVGSTSSIAARTNAHLSPQDPLHWLIREKLEERSTTTEWMFRVLDVGEALERRGYPPVVSAETVLRVDDPALPGNSGTWGLRVSEGAGTATRLEDDGGRVPVLGPRGLACLYAGQPTSALRRAGLLVGGDPAEDHVLDAAFAGPAAYLLDFF